MKNLTNNQIMKSMRSEHKMSNIELAGLIGAQVNTVKNWLKDPQSNGFRPAPDHAIRCLIYALHLRELGVDPVKLKSPDLEVTPPSSPAPTKQ